LTEDTKNEGLNEESDANARVKGADPQGESAPDAGTKPEQRTGAAPDVSSADTDAVQDVAERNQSEVGVVGAGPETLEVRQGMFGIKGTGDTSGYGGLTRTVEFPPPSGQPFGGWWDQVYDRVGEIFSKGGDPLGPPRGDAFSKGGDPLGPPRKDAFSKGGDPLGPPRKDINRGDVITKVVIHRGEITFHVARAHLADLAQHLRDDPHLRFEFLSSVSGVHYPADRGRELHVIYQLQSMTYNRRIRLEVSAPDSDPHVPSVVATYPTADWHERETYDMFGIVFDGHPALTRILMPDDWPGHPQRKDYPLGGIPVEYKGATIPPPDQRRSYS
jgi:NADH-quinone oxidoreductase subunit C